MNDNQIISIETNQTGFEVDMREGIRGVSPLEITHSDHLRRFDPEMYSELNSSESLETIRRNLFSLLHRREMASTPASATWRPWRGPTRSTA